MARQQSPAFQWYPKDFLTSERVIRMTYEQRGIYITLLSQCWLEGSIPGSIEELAEQLMIRKTKAEAVLPKIIAAFKDRAGRLVHPRLEEERRKQREYREKQRLKGEASAAKRFNRGSTVVQPMVVDGRLQPQSNSPISISSFRSPDSSPSTEAALRSVDSTTDQMRAGRLVERYGDLYAEYRHGARHRQRPNLDWLDAISLVKLWPDDRLDKLAILVLTTDDDWIAKTDRSFKIFAMKATWADQRLAAWEANQAKAGAS